LRLRIATQRDRVLGAVCQRESRVGHACAVAAETGRRAVGKRDVGAVGVAPPAAHGAIRVGLVGVIVRCLEPFVPTRDEVLRALRARELILELLGPIGQLDGDKRAHVVRAVQERFAVEGLFIMQLVAIHRCGSPTDVAHASQFIARRHGESLPAVLR